MDLMDIGKVVKNDRTCVNDHLSTTNSQSPSFPKLIAIF